MAFAEKYVELHRLSRFSNFGAKMDEQKSIEVSLNDFDQVEMPIR